MYSKPPGVPCTLTPVGISPPVYINPAGVPCTLANVYINLLPPCYGKFMGFPLVMGNLQEDYPQHGHYSCHITSYGKGGVNVHTRCLKMLHRFGWSLKHDDQNPVTKCFIIFFYVRNNEIIFSTTVVLRHRG